MDLLLAAAQRDYGRLYCTCLCKYSQSNKQVSTGKYIQYACHHQIKGQLMLHYFVLMMWNIAKGLSLSYNHVLLHIRYRLLHIIK